MDTNTDGFVQLRKAILDQAVNMLDSDSVPLEDRYTLSLQIAQTHGTLEAYQKTFQLAQQLDAENKLNIYLDLLGDVDARIEQNHSQQQDNAPEQGNTEG